MDPETILSETDCGKERTPSELAQWVEEKNDLFRHTKEGRKYLAQRKGLAERFVDVIFPLCHLAQYLFGRRLDVVCKATLADEVFDALVIDYRDRPLRVQQAQFSHAILCYEEYVRRLCVPEGVHVPALSKLLGREVRKHPDKGRSDDEAVTQIVLINKALELIAGTARSKVGRSYGKDAWLVIIFDDYATFRTPADMATLRRFVHTEILPLHLDFGRLFLVGWSGETVMGFALGGTALKKAEHG
ncbi:MAG: hypothetical protein ACE5K1_06745 [Acidiferrobacterales bacterium]